MINNPNKQNNEKQQNDYQIEMLRRVITLYCTYIALHKYYTNSNTLFRWKSYELKVQKRVYQKLKKIIRQGLDHRVRIKIRFCRDQIK